MYVRVCCKYIHVRIYEYINAYVQRYEWSCLELNGSAEVPFLWRSSRGGGGGFELHKQYGQCKANLQTSCRISLAVDSFNDQDNEDDDTEDEGEHLLTRCRQGSQAEPISIHFLELPVARRIGIGGMFGIEILLTSSVEEKGDVKFFLQGVQENSVQEPWERRAEDAKPCQT